MAATACEAPTTGAKGRKRPAPLPTTSRIRPPGTRSRASPACTTRRARRQRGRSNAPLLPLPDERPVLAEHRIGGGLGHARNALQRLGVVDRARPLLVAPRRIVGIGTDDQ